MVLFAMCLRGLLFCGFALAASLGDPSAQFWLGQAYHHGDSITGISPDAERAFALLEAAVESGHVAAWHYWASLHREGDPWLGVARDPATTRAFLEAAAEAGDATSCFELAHDAKEGTGGSDVDLARALHWFERAGTMGHAEALCAAGAMRFHGLGCAQEDKAAAAELYKQAAERGHVGAWINLADMYAAGDGVPRDEALARDIQTRILPLLRKKA